MLSCCWTFCECDNLEGTSSDNNKIKMLTHSSEGRTLQSYVLLAWLVNTATGNELMHRNATCRRIELGYTFIGSCYNVMCFKLRMLNVPSREDHFIDDLPSSHFKKVKVDANVVHCFCKMGISFLFSGPIDNLLITGKTKLKTKLSWKWLGNQLFSLMYQERVHLRSCVTSLGRLLGIFTP